MKVKELIEKLMLIENKELDVVCVSNFGRGCFSGFDDLRFEEKECVNELLIFGEEVFNDNDE